MSATSANPPRGSEARRSPRYPVPPAGGAVSVVGAQLLNVSAYGALIESFVPMEPGAVLPLRLVVAREKADVSARVVGCVSAPSAPRRTYRVGLEFVSLSPALRERLSEALRSLGSASG